jgi:hypothetical protein
MERVTGIDAARREVPGALSVDHLIAPHDREIQNRAGSQPRLS